LSVVRSVAAGVTDVRSVCAGPLIADGGQLVVTGLPRVPEGKAYELWTLRSGTPRPAGVFHVDDAGRAAVGVAAADGAVEGFAVSVEPASGVLVPTGPIVLASAP